MPRHPSVLANFSYVNGVVKVDLQNKILNKLQKVSDVRHHLSNITRSTAKHDHVMNISSNEIFLILANFP